MILTSKHNGMEHAAMRAAGAAKIQNRIARGRELDRAAFDGEGGEWRGERCVVERDFTGGSQRPAMAGQAQVARNFLAADLPEPRDWRTTQSALKVINQRGKY